MQPVIIQKIELLTDATTVRRPRRRSAAAAATDAPPAASPPAEPADDAAQPTPPPVHRRRSEPRQPQPVRFRPASRQRGPLGHRCVPRVSSTGPARAADALYLLGDLFEVWVGDDDDNADNARACAGLARLTAQRRPGVRAARQSRLPAGRGVRATHRRQTTARPGAARPVRRADAAQPRRRVLHRRSCRTRSCAASCASRAGSGASCRCRSRRAVTWRAPRAPAARRIRSARSRPSWM